MTVVGIMLARNDHWVITQKATELWCFIAIVHTDEKGVRMNTLGNALVVLDKIPYVNCGMTVVGIMLARNDH